VLDRVAHLAGLEDLALVSTLVDEFLFGGERDSASNYDAS
jgi:hypothetical protein